MLGRLGSILVCVDFIIDLSVRKTRSGLGNCLIYSKGALSYALWLVAAVSMNAVLAKKGYWENCMLLQLILYL